ARISSNTWSITSMRQRSSIRDSATPILEAPDRPDAERPALRLPDLEAALLPLYPGARREGLRRPAHAIRARRGDAVQKFRARTDQRLRLRGGLDLAPRLAVGALGRDRRGVGYSRDLTDSRSAARIASAMVSRRRWASARLPCGGAASASATT